MTTSGLKIDCRPGGKQLAALDPHAPGRLAACREAVIGSLRNVYGVSDKVLAMALSSMLLGAGKDRPLWFEVGATFVWRSSLAPTWHGDQSSWKAAAPN
jgi:hypothetical protein